MPAPEVGGVLASLAPDAGAKELQEAASELVRLGVRSRESVGPRGSLFAPAPNRLPEPERVLRLIECLEHSDKDVRSQAALAMGEWGGQEAAEALARRLEVESDEDVQLYCVTALRLIGGTAAVEALRSAAERGTTERVRFVAKSAIAELATGGQDEDGEAAGF